MSINSVQAGENDNPPQVEIERLKYGTLLDEGQEIEILKY